MDRSCRPGAAFPQTFRGQVRAENGPWYMVSFLRGSKEFLPKVSFYKGSLHGKTKVRVSEQIAFLQNHEISTAGTRINETDLVLVGASAVIPVFRFERWRYHGLDEIVVFGPSFDHNFATPGTRRWSVCSGRVISTGKCFSPDALRKGLLKRKTGTTRPFTSSFTSSDKMDGQVDGIPKVIIRRQYVLPWFDLLKRKIGEIEEGQSDINRYAAMGNEEFLAVTAEYFFERPEKMKERHPDLHKALPIRLRTPNEILPVTNLSVARLIRRLLFLVS